MAIQVRLRITSPNGVIRFVNPTEVTLNGEVRQAASLTAKFIDNLDVYESEDVESTTNAVQLNSLVELIRIIDDNFIIEFEGNITFKADKKLGAGRWEISIVALDKLFQGRQTRASQSNADTWEYSSPTANTGTITMLASVAPLTRPPWSDPLNYYLPEFDPNDWDLSSAPWLALDSNNYNSSPLQFGINAGSYVINTGVLNTPVAGQMTLTLDATGLPNLDDEFVVNESMLLDGENTSDYTPNAIISVGSVAANELVIVIDQPSGAVAITAPGEGWTAKTLTIELSPNQDGILPSGVGMIDNEMVKFDGDDLNATGNYTLKNVRRDFFFMGLSPLGVHTAQNVYTGTKVASTIEITGGVQYPIATSQNALFPVGATIISATLGNLIVTASAWDGTKTTISVAEDISGFGGAHNITTDNRFINVRPQKVAPGEFLFEGLISGDPVIINEKTFEIDYGQGWVVSSLAFGLLGRFWSNVEPPVNNSPTAYRVAYNYYDETDANTLTIEDATKIIAERLQTIKGQIVGETEDNGGWGLPLASVNVGTFLGALKITKLISDEPQLSFELLDDLLTDLGLLDVVGYNWDSPNSEFALDLLSQGAVTKSYQQIKRVVRDTVMDELYSGLLVKHELPAVANLASLFFWAATKHSFITTAPQAFGIQVVEGVGTDGYNYTTFGSAPTTRSNIITSHRQNAVSVVTDGLDTTSYSLEYGDTPGSDAPSNPAGTAGEPLYFVWFDEPGFYAGVDCASKMIDHIRCVLDVRQWSNKDVYTGNYQVDIQVVGYTGFTSPDAGTEASPLDVAPIPTGEVELPGLRIQYQNPSGNVNLSGTRKVVLDVSGINLELVAIGIKFNACPTDKSGSGGSPRNVQCMLKGLLVEEARNKSIFVKIIDDEGLAGSDSASLYAPLTTKKLVNPNYKVKEVDVGIATKGAATTLGRGLLLQSLVLKDSREIELGVGGLHLPALMETISALSPKRPADNFTGVVLSKQYTLMNGVESLTVLLRDFTAPLFT